MAIRHVPGRHGVRLSTRTVHHFPQVLMHFLSDLIVDDQDRFLLSDISISRNVDSSYKLNLQKDLS
jgi:hypothetical protein